MSSVCVSSWLFVYTEGQWRNYYATLIYSTCKVIIPQEAIRNQTSRSWNGFVYLSVAKRVDKKIHRRGKRGVANAAPLALGDSERGTGCVLSQVSNFSPNRNAVLISFAQRALDLHYHPKRQPDRGGCAVRDRNPPKKPKGAPEQARPRTRTTARHRRFPKTEPTSTRAAHPARNHPKTTPDERGTSSSLKALINAVAEIPTVSSLHR